MFTQISLSVFDICREQLGHDATRMEDSIHFSSNVALLFIRILLVRYSSQFLFSDVIIKYTFYSNDSSNTLSKCQTPIFSVS